MKGKILLIRIALIAAIGSLLFAIVTLIRAIVRGQGEMIAAVSVVGSVFVTVMCATRMRARPKTPRRRARLP